MRHTSILKLYMILSLLLGLAVSGTAWALTLDEAKTAGLVGEKLDGYVGIVAANPSPDLQELVASTNDGRRKVYQEQAERNGITVEAVGIVSAEKLQEKAPAGQFVQVPSGQWQKK
jgi:uncharacterized protein